MIPVLLLLALGGLMHAAGTFSAAGSTVAGPELAFGYLLLSAYFTGKLVNRFGLPKLTGYIIAGIVVGPAVLHLVDTGMTKQLKLVGDAATALLALQAGSELELKSVRPIVKTVISMAGWAILGTMLVMTGLLVAMRPLVPFLDALPFTAAVAVAATMGVAMSAQSPAVVMALLAETRAEGLVSRMMLTMVVVADLMVIILYGVASSAATAVVAGGGDLGAAIGGIAWEIGGSLILGLVIGWLIAQFIASVKGGVGLFIVMICFVMAEVGHAVHLDPLVILLSAGIFVRNSKADVHVLVDGLDAASLPVFLVFFALAGAKVNLVALYTLALPVGLIVITRATSFYVGSRIACARSGADPAVRKYAWFGLTPQAGLALALAELVRRTFPQFGAEAFSLVVGVVAINELIAPIMLRVALLRSGEAGKRATHDFAADH